MDAPIPFPKALSLLAACAAKDASRFRLDCVRLRSHDGFMRWEATDGRIAVRVDVDVDGAAPGVDVLIPAEALADAAKSAAKGRARSYEASLAYTTEGLRYQAAGGPATLIFTPKGTPEARAAFPDIDTALPSGEAFPSTDACFNVELLSKASVAVMALGSSPDSEASRLTFYGPKQPCKITPMLPRGGVRATGLVMPVGVA